MTVRKTKGVFSGRHTGPGAKREAVNAEWEIETDDETGLVSHGVKSARAGERRTRRTIRNIEIARHIARMQEQLRSEQAIIDYENRPVVPFLKEPKASPGVPKPGDIIACPYCNGKALGESCPICDDERRIEYSKAKRRMQSLTS